LGTGVVWIVYVTDADTVVLRSVVWLYLVTLGETAYTPLLYTIVLQVLGHHLRALDGESHVDFRSTRILIGISGKADEGARMLI
jgi:hypothetical protein